MPLLQSGKQGAVIGRKDRTARKEKVWREKEMNEITKTILLSAVTALITVLACTKIAGV